MKKLFLLIVVIMGLWQVGQAQPKPQDNKDTLWTKELWQLGSEIYKVKFTPDGNNVAAAFPHGVYFFDRLAGNMVKQFVGHIYEYVDFDFSDNGKILVTTSQTALQDNSWLTIWDTEKADTIRILDSIAFDKISLINDSLLIGIGRTKNDTRSMLKININTWQIINKEKSPGNVAIAVTTFAVDKVHNLFAIVTVSQDQNDNSRYIELWDLKTVKKIITLGSHANRVWDLAFSSDGKYLASSSSDGVINIWDIKQQKLYKSLLHDAMIDAGVHVAFSPNCGFLVSSGGSGSPYTKIWDMNNFKIVYQYTRPFGAITSFDISKDSLFISVSHAYALLMLNSHWTSTGIIEPPKDNVQKLFPNPSGNEITIPFESGLVPLSIKIINTSGQVEKTITKIEPVLNNIKIDISSLASDTYFVSALYPTKTITYKFVKER